MNKSILPALCLYGLFSGAAFAGPADYVYTPIVEQGEREIDVKFGSASLPSGEKKQVGSIGIGYGATEWWFAEVYLKSEHESPEPRLNILEFENKFQLTETGKYPLEVGLIAELEIPLNKGGEADEFKFGPLFQTEFGRLQLNGNLLLETKFGGDAEAAHETVFQYQWQAKYRWRREFEFGLQGFGETGKWNGWAPRSEQEYRMGPAIFGKLPLGVHEAIKYNAAWLIGMTDATPNNTFRMQMEYEF
ncbi:MAG: hypothetical protein C3F18_12345 [Nitrosomonadales bacterium]|nr:MAG: hypothetical protein C3F18_12345 [Nitrosomonadales bacterium]